MASLFKLLITSFFIVNIIIHSVFARTNNNGDETINAAVIKDFAPQYVTKKGKATGFAVDTLNAIAGIAGIKINYLQFDTWGETHKAVKEGKAVIIPNVGIVEKRKKIYDFASPVETFPISIFVRQSNLSINSFAELSGKHVGLVKSNVGVKLMEGRSDVKISIYNHLNDVLFALLSGEVDAIIYPKTVVEYHAKRIGVFDKIKTTGSYLKEVKRGIAIKKGNSELTARLEKATQQFLRSPEYRQIYSKWHAEPEPYWNSQKVIVLSALIALVLIIMAAIVHFLSLQKINQNLNETIKAKQITEDELIKAKEEADAANVAKSQFLSNMSHEIRTPMNGVFGMVQLLEDTALSDEQKEYTNSIMHCGDNLLTIINDILDLSKLEAGKVTLESTDVNLKQLFIECVGLLKPKANEKHIDLSLDYLVDCSDYFIGDSTRIRQIVLNLLGNALKFTEHGSVTVRVSCQSSNQVTFEFTDTGVGIKEDALKNIFNDFSQADEATTRKFGGTGLGLAISKKLVEVIGGNISVTSIFGDGTTFVVNLNLVESDTVNEPIKESENKDGFNFRGHILLAEDVITNQLIAKAFLTKMGVTVDVVENGLEAIAAHKDNHYDLIFMDCRMPELDGYKATKKIRALERENKTDVIPIVALTANVTKEDKDLCLSIGMNDIVAKPYKRNELAECLGKYLEAQY